MTKAKKGGFRDTTLEYMVYALLKEVRLRSNLDPNLVEDVCLGNVSKSAMFPAPVLLVLLVGIYQPFEP